MPTLQRPPFVLFADDDVDTLELLRYWTRMKGWRGDFVTSARGVLEKVNEFCDGNNQDCYDCIVTDYNFLDQDDGQESSVRLTGYTAARAIRKNYPNLPILFVTGFSGPILKDQITKLGTADLLEKPVDCEALFRQIEFLVRWNRAACPVNYEGPDRRRSSINRSGYRRRSTDQVLVVPPIIEHALAEVKHKVMRNDSENRSDEVER